MLCSISMAFCDCGGWRGGGSFPYTSVDKWWRERGCYLEEDEVKNSRDIFVGKVRLVLSRRLELGENVT